MSEQGGKNKGVGPSRWGCGKEWGECKGGVRTGGGGVSVLCQWQRRRVFLGRGGAEVVVGAEDRLEGTGEREGGAANRGLQSQKELVSVG